MTDEEFGKVINARLEALFDLYPIEDLRPIEVKEEMKAGLMKAYADKGYRMYLENSVKIALKNMAVAPDQQQIIYYKSRVDVLEQLLAKGKQMFETIKKK
jgi:hypothetical protein